MVNPNSTQVVVEPSISGVSWAAVAAGAVAVPSPLIAFGTGLGLSVVSPWSGAGISESFKIRTGMYFVAMAMMSSAIGGYLAGRLRNKWIGVHAAKYLSTYGAWLSCLSVCVCSRSSSAGFSSNFDPEWRRYGSEPRSR